MRLRARFLAFILLSSLFLCILPSVPADVTLSCSSSPYCVFGYDSGTGATGTVRVTGDYTLASPVTLTATELFFNLTGKTATLPNNKFIFEAWNTSSTGAIPITIQTGAVCPTSLLNVASYSYSNPNITISTLLSNQTVTVDFSTRIAHLKITTVGGGSNLTAINPYTYYEFQVNVTDTGTMNNVENVTIRVEQNPSVAIESDTPGYVEESKYWFRYDNDTNSWEWYNTTWTGASNWLDAANCSKPLSSATEGYFKFKIRLSKIATKATNWDFDAIAQDIQIGATATKKFDAFAVNTYSEYSLSPSGITWNVNPGDVNATATAALTITVTSNTVMKIQIDGNGDLVLVGGTNTIPLANVVVDDDSNPNTDARCLTLTQSYQDWWISIPAGANQDYTMYWFLSVPLPCPAGTYQFTFYITVIE